MPGQRQNRAMTPEEYAKLAPAEREAAGQAWFDEQERRDAAGQLRAIEQGRSRPRSPRARRGDEAQLEQEWDDDIARIGSVDDETWDRLTPKERHAAVACALGRDIDPDHDHPI